MLIVFDIDDTLIDTTGKITRPLWKKVLEAMEEKGLFFENRSKALFHLWALDQNTQSSSETLHLFLAFYKKDFSFHEIGMAVLSELPKERIAKKALPFVLEGLKILKGSHTLAIVSCGDEEIQKKKLQESKISLSWFSKIFISQDRDKKKSYQKLLEELSFSPQESYVIGDRVMIDLKPAKELGMHTVQMKWGRGRVYSPWSEYVDREVYRFEELIAYLQKEKIGVGNHGSE